MDFDESCPNGHTKPTGSEYTFCGHCGGVFARQQRDVPTPGLVKLAELLGLNPSDAVEDPGMLVDKGIGINVHSVTSYDDQNVNLAVAVPFAQASEYGDEVVAKSKREVDEAFAQAERWRELLLGDDEREIQMFVSSYYSY